MQKILKASVHFLCISNKHTSQYVLNIHWRNFDIKVMLIVIAVFVELSMYKLVHKLSVIVV